MRVLGAAEVLELWEWGRALSPVRRALGTVLWADPAVEWRDLEGWTVGRRDAALLAVRRRLFGAHVAGAAGCPRCDEPVDLEFDLGDGADPPAEDPADLAPV